MSSSPENLIAELDKKITYTENTLLLLCDVTAGIKNTLQELDKTVPSVFKFPGMADYGTMVDFCKEHNLICLETYYRKKHRKEGMKYEKAWQKNK